MPGPTQKPAKLRLMEGRGRGRDSGGRVVKDTPAFRRIPPTKPDDLSPFAAEHWDAIMPELNRLELVKETDVGSLALLCEAYSRWRTARDQRVRDGLVIENSHGPTRNPAAIAEEAASKDYRSWAAEFGLTPSAESKLTVKEAPDGQSNPFAGGSSATV